MVRREDKDRARILQTSAINAVSLTIYKFLSAPCGQASNASAPQVSLSRMTLLEFASDTNSRPKYWKCCGEKKPIHARMGRRRG